MRDTKIRYVYKGDYQIHYKYYYLSELDEKSLKELSDLHNQMPLISRDEYTELKDKNDKEIYEGDILNVVDKIRIENYMFKPVFYEGGCFSIECERDTLMCINGIASGKDHNGSHECYVVGNVHENQELINELS